MNLDRNIRGKDGKGKYALVRLRTIEPGDEAHRHLQALEALGVLDWGVKGDPDEFFVIRLKDKYALAALEAYAHAAKDDDVQWSTEILTLACRAGMLNPYCKQPD